MNAPSPATARPAVAFYIGGFEAIGGIEACFEDLALGLTTAPIDLSVFVWASDLPPLRDIAGSGAVVHRVGLRKGCRYDLPDWALYVVHGAKLKTLDRIVFGKIPPDSVFRRMLRMLDANPAGRPELIYVTPYRPAEMWPAGLPPLVGGAIDTMLVQSETFTSDLRAMGFSGRILELPYLPPRVAMHPVAAPPSDRVCRLGFLGRFVPQKNLFYLLDILCELAGETVELHLFGDGPQDRVLRERAARESLPATFHGPVPRSDVPAAIDSCDVFLNPSVSEGQCLVALEVLSRGRPFLGSSVGAIPQILERGHFGAFLPLENAAAAARIIRGVIAEWRAGVWAPTDVARDYAAAYQPDTILRRYADIFSGSQAHRAVRDRNGASDY